MKDEMVCLEPFDWRYSAAIVGLRKYLEWLGVEESDLTITEESLEYNKKYFNRRDFLKFAEFYFKNEMHHIAIEEILEEEMEQDLSDAEELKEEETEDEEPVSKEDKKAAKKQETVKQPVTDQKSEKSSSSQSVTSSQPPQEPIISNTPESSDSEPVIVEPPVSEEVHYDYDIGNCGRLYDSETEAYQAAEAAFNDFSDPDRYVSSYVVYSTYDKWTISYYYSYY